MFDIIRSISAKTRILRADIKENLSSMGKYEKNGDKVTMPVNLMVAHAVADGYHSGLFFRYLQEEIDGLQAEAKIPTTIW